MPDITACENNKCPMRKECYRYMCPRGSIQSFAMFEPRIFGNCEYFMRIEKGRKLRILKEGE